MAPFIDPSPLKKLLCSLLEIWWRFWSGLVLYLWPSLLEDEHEDRLCQGHSHPDSL